MAYRDLLEYMCEALSANSTDSNALKEHGGKVRCCWNPG